jgi:hypothetical protein
MCFFVAFFALGPRFFMLLWWLLFPGRWEATFDSAFWPILGFVFLPWTTLMYVAVAPFGGVNGVDWFLLVFAFLCDMLGFSGGGLFARRRVGYA